MSGSSEPSILDFLEFAQLAYDLYPSNGPFTLTGPRSVPTPTGFTVLTHQAYPLSGLDAVAFVNQNTNQIVLAYRGSVSVTQDWLGTDLLSITPGHRGQAFIDAEAFGASIESAYPDYTLYVTGHSLGASEAEDVAALLQIGGVTFAGTGVTNILAPYAPKTDPKLTDYVNADDPVGNYATDTSLLPAPPGYHVGTVVTLPSTALYYSALYYAGFPGLGVSAYLFHPLSKYAAALLQAGLIPFNPFTQSSIESTVDLAETYPGIENLVSGDLNGNFTESGTLAISTLDDPTGDFTLVAQETVDSSGTLTFVSTIYDGVVPTVTQTETINPQGTLLQDQVAIDGGVTIEASSSDPIAINVSPAGAIIIGVPSQQEGDEITINAGGVDDDFDSVIIGGDSVVAAQTIYAFYEAANSQDDTLDITYNSSGVPTLTDDIGSDDSFEVESDSAVSSVSQDFDFAGLDGTLEVSGSLAFYGTIYDMMPGDVIYLNGARQANGFYATSASLGLNNVLTVSDDGVTVATLQLDPAQSFADDTFYTEQAAYGGADITESASNPIIVTSDAQTVTAYGQPGDTSYYVDVNLSPLDVDFGSYRISDVTTFYTLASEPITATVVYANLGPPSNAVYVGPASDGDWYGAVGASISYYNVFGVLTFELNPQDNGDNPQGGSGSGNISVLAVPGNYSDTDVPIGVYFEGDNGVTIDLNLSAKIYEAAVPELLVNGEQQSFLDFGYLHVGQTSSVDVDIANVASGNLNDTLLSLAGTLGEFSWSGFSDLAAGDTATDTIVLSADTAGVAGDGINTDAFFGLVSHDPDLPDQPVNTEAPDVFAYVYNYAEPTLILDAATTNFDLTDDYGDWTLNLGTTTVGSVLGGDATIDIENGAPSSVWSDMLQGNLTLGTPPNGGFSQSIPGVEDETAEDDGGYFELGVFSPESTTVGSYSETIVFHPLSVDLAGSTALSDLTLTVTATVVGPDIPGASVSIDDGLFTVSAQAGETADIDPLFTGSAPAALIIQGPGTAEVAGAASVSNLDVASGGSLYLNGGIINTDPVTVGPSGDMFGFGTISGDETVNGVVTALGGTLELTGAVTGSGTFFIMPGSTLRFDGPVGSGAVIDFDSGGTGALELADPGDMQGAILGQVSGDTVTNVSCFAAGTHIRTPAGEVAVEDLLPGERVETVSGVQAQVVWVGRRRITCRHHPRPERVWPVRIQAAAFGEGLPRRDLLLSPDHAVYAKGVLIPIKHLINGMSVAQIEVDEVTYYHIELARHDLLLANGLPAESLLPGGDRSGFGNGSGAVRLPPDFHSLAWEAKGCARLVVTGPEVGAVRAFLAERASLLSTRPLRERIQPVTDRHGRLPTIAISASCREGATHGRPASRTQDGKPGTRAGRARGRASRSGQAAAEA